MKIIKDYIKMKNIVQNIIPASDLYLRISNSQNDSERRKFDRRISGYCALKLLDQIWIDKDGIEYDYKKTGTKRYILTPEFANNRDKLHVKYKNEIRYTRSQSLKNSFSIKEISTIEKRPYHGFHMYFAIGIKVYKAMLDKSVLPVKFVISRNINENIKPTNNFINLQLPLAEISRYLPSIKKHGQFLITIEDHETSIKSNNSTLDNMITKLDKTSFYKELGSLFNGDITKMGPHQTHEFVKLNYKVKQLSSFTKIQVTENIKFLILNL